MLFDRRRREWLLKVTLVELGLWVARADGEVTRKEARLILRLLQEWGTTRAELSQLKVLGELRLLNGELPTEALRLLPSLLSEEQRPIFLDVLAEIAFDGQERCSAKIGRLLDVCRAMRFDQTQALKRIDATLARLRAKAEQTKQGAAATQELPNPFSLERALAELGLERPDLTAARQAYRRLTLLYHPDRHPEADSTQQEKLLRKLMQVRKAYQQILAANRPPTAAAG